MEIIFKHWGIHEEKTNFGVFLIFSLKKTIPLTLNVTFITKEGYLWRCNKHWGYYILFLKKLRAINKKNKTSGVSLKFSHHQSLELVQYRVSYVVFWVKAQEKNHVGLGPKWIISYHVLEWGVVDGIRAWTNQKCNEDIESCIGVIVTVINPLIWNSVSLGKFLG